MPFSGQTPSATAAEHRLEWNRGEGSWNPWPQFPSEVSILNTYMTYTSAGKKLIPPPMQMFTVKYFFCSNRLFHKFGHCIIGSTPVLLCCLLKSGLCSQSTAHWKHTTPLSQVPLYKTSPASTQRQHQQHHTNWTVSLPSNQQLTTAAGCVLGWSRPQLCSCRSNSLLCVGQGSTRMLWSMSHSSLNIKYLVCIPYRSLGVFFPERPNTEQELLGLTLLVSH